MGSPLDLHVLFSICEFIHKTIDFPGSMVSVADYQSVVEGMVFAAVFTDGWNMYAVLPDQFMLAEFRLFYPARILCGFRVPVVATIP